MKNELNPKAVWAIVSVVTVVAIGSLFYFTKGQADRSGPKWTVDLHSGKQKTRMGMPPGWHPGVVQGQAGQGAAPGQGGAPGGKP